MGRSIEPTGLAHRKHYRTQGNRALLSEIRNHSGFEAALRTFVHSDAKGCGIGINRFAEKLSMKSRRAAERDLNRAEN